MFAECIFVHIIYVSSFWSCNASADLKILSQKPGSDDLVLSEYSSFRKKQAHAIFSDFSRL